LTAFHWMFGVGAVLAATCGVLAAFLRNYRFAPTAVPSSSDGGALPVPSRFVE
jgi:hypothetical protein